MNTGELLKEARKRAGLTQKQLGELCGIAEPTIRKYESGKLNPKRETLQKLAKPLNVKWYELYSENEGEQLSAVADFVFNVAEEALSKYRDNTISEDIFVSLFKSDSLQEIGRRGVEIEERDKKRTCELKGQSYTPLSDELFNERVKDHIAGLLYRYEVFPKSIDSLVSVGFSEAFAYAMMELAKIHSGYIEKLPPDYRENIIKTASMIEMSKVLSKKDDG